ILPQGRMLLQQGLMKIGLFKPKLEKPVESTQEVTSKEENTDGNTLFSDDDGNITKVADLKGKVVFMNFWATWCPPCKAEMPSIQVLKEKFKDREDVVFLLVEIEHEQEKAHDFLKQNNLDLPIYYPESQIPANWLGQSIPATVILDKNGNIAGKHEGMADYSSQQV